MRKRSFWVVLLFLSVPVILFVGCVSDNDDDTTTNEADDDSAAPTDDDDDNDDNNDNDAADDDTTPADDDTTPADDDTIDDDTTSEYAIAVGGSENYGPVAWIRGPKGWSALTFPGVPTLYPLNDVSAFNDAGAFLVGGYGQTAGVYEYKDGTLIDRSFACYSCWQFGVSALNATRAASAGCYANMGFTTSRIWIDDGVQFTAASVAEPNANGMCVARDISWINQDEAVAVGRDYYTNLGILWSGNEQGFALEEPPAVTGSWQLTAVAACPGDEVYAVGTHGAVAQGLVLRRTAKGWSKETLPAISLHWDLRGIGCSDDSVFAVGYDWINGRGLLLKKTAAWTSETLPLADGRWGLDAIATDSNGGGYLVGYDLFASRAVIFRGSAGEWQPEEPPAAEENQPLLGVAIFD